MAPPTALPPNSHKLYYVLKPRAAAIDFAAKKVIVRVGRPATNFHVDGDTFRAASEFFKAALGEQWVEGQKGVVELPEHRAEAFDIYVNWLYRRGIYRNKFARGSTLKLV